MLVVMIMKISVGVSNRHVHLKHSDLNILFGEGYELNNIGDLSQPGQFKAKETVTIKTTKNEIENVRVLGPCRLYTQIEISKTDAYKLGLNPPIRNSGDLMGSEEITIIGPKGEVTTNGCIIATRHIHLTEEQKKYYKLEGKDTVNVLLPGEKGGIITNVYLKTASNSFFELHLDTDDANAHLIKNGDIVDILED